MHLDIQNRKMFASPHLAALDFQPSPEEAALEQAALLRIVAAHEAYLSRRRGMRAKLANARLDHLTIAGRNLSEADLSGASLVVANLRGANLSHASFYCADLTGCDLSGARLDHADLRGASFKDANLSRAVMDHADLRAATMLHLGDTLKFQGNAHDEAPFGAVDFSGASLRHVSFRNAKLDNANFTDALLQGSSFRGARLRKACFRGAVVAGVHLDELMVEPQALSQSLMSPTASAHDRAREIYAALVGHHEWFTSNGKKGQPAVVDGEDLRPLSDAMKGLCLAGLSARAVVAVGVDFAGCQLQAARFDGADLRAAGFNAADLSGTSFRRAKLAHATFKNAKIRDLILCTGQKMVFQADPRAGLMAQLGQARIRPIALIALLGEQKGTCGQPTRRLVARSAPWQKPANIEAQKAPASSRSLPLASDCCRLAGECEDGRACSNGWQRTRSKNRGAAGKISICAGSALVRRQRSSPRWR